MNQALDAVAGLAKNPANKKALKTQAYALYVLAKAGKPDKGMMDHLRDKQAADLTADARAVLAAAYAATGNAKGGEKLLANLAAPAPRPPRRGHLRFTPCAPRPSCWPPWWT